MSETGRKCGWVKRKLHAGEPLTGELLEFALRLIPEPGWEGDKYSEMWASMAQKLNAGEPLGNYEHHLLVDVFLLHARLGAAEAERLGSES
jgi:hypothetical protein